MAAATHVLPEDLVVDILARLPVKSLKRFRSVSPSWRSLVDSSQFVSSHFSFSKKKTCPLVKLQNFHEDKAIFVKLSNTTLDVVASFLKPPFGCDVVSINILGCFNGIICLWDHNDGVVLWNPATKEFKIPSLFPFGYPLGYEHRVYAIGFGYDFKRGDYKVVRIDTFLYDDPGASRGKRLALYSLNTDAWRELDGSFNVDEILGAGSPINQVYLDGYFHWRAADKEVELLLSFDISNEVFITTPYPDGGFGKSYETTPHYLSYFFTKINGSVAMLFCHDPFVADKWYDVWVLGEIGVKNSWTKILTIGPIISAYSPLGVDSNGEFFFSKAERGGEHLLRHDPSTNETKRVSIGGWALELTMFAESLVSLSPRSAFNH